MKHNVTGMDIAKNVRVPVAYSERRELIFPRKITFQGQRRITDPMERKVMKVPLRNWRSSEAMAFEYIEVFYNRRRLHSTLGYKPPMQYLEDWPNSISNSKVMEWTPTSPNGI